MRTPTTKAEQQQIDAQVLETIQIDGQTYKVISRRLTEDTIKQYPKVGGLHKQNGVIASLTIQKPKGRNLYIAYEYETRGKTHYRFIG